MTYVSKRYIILALETKVSIKGRKDMRHKSRELMEQIEECINEEYCRTGVIPTMQSIADILHISKGSVSKYIAEMRRRGMVEQDGSFRTVKTPAIRKMQGDIAYIPIVGSISCGKPLFAEENIETYLPMPKDLLGSGKFFILTANGDSMIEAGIEDGDYVIVRKQETANSGQIVVALIEDETTLKRIYYDDTNRRICLHPENEKLKDMYFEHVDIQGIAVKVIKNVM